MHRLCILLSLCIILPGICDDEDIDKTLLKKQAYDLFMHGYRSYMDFAFPADELMPLSCKGRMRGVTTSRGDVDDSLGNFSLTLIDTLDTLVVIGAIDEFEQAIRLVVDTVRFDSDFVVSVFETNIRVLGGLISGHIMTNLVKSKEPHRFTWYNDHLLKMAVEVADRLLPAYNTTSGIPYSRINLRHGMLDYLKRQKDTCTACGGTMLLEMAALSRLTGNDIYEKKAHKAMDFLWGQRHRASDLMGTVLNVHSGDWVRRESGIGAGIDSYYEYCLKAYILLGDTNYLDRFNKHYDAVMRYVNKGPLFVDVHMHRPTVATRSFMDALLAFWPGIQVLKGDVKQAIEMHEMLYQVVKKHKFLPEAFTHDFQVHWGEHPLRPEFIESTYFLYRATKDTHYLRVAKQVMDSIEQYVKVPCGFAGVKDVRTMQHEDRMDSFVLSETFKYLYMIFAEPDDILFNPDDYIMTTEAHFIPLSMGTDLSETIPRRIFIRYDDFSEYHQSANPFASEQIQTEPAEALKIRERTKSVLEELFVLQEQQGSQQQQCLKPSERLRAWAFSATNADHIKALRDMGVDIEVQEDGRMQLSHHSANAKTPEFAKWGYEFMQEMAKFAASIENAGIGDVTTQKYVQLIGYPYLGTEALVASPAQFGNDLSIDPVVGGVRIADPLFGCRVLKNKNEIRGKIAVVKRSDCMFQDKARNAQEAGAIAVIVIDHVPGTSYKTSPPFAMAASKNTEDDIRIPTLFLHSVEADVLLNAMEKDPELVLRIGIDPLNSDRLIEQFFLGELVSRQSNLQCLLSESDFIRVFPHINTVVFNFRFGGVNTESEPLEHQAIVERHALQLQDVVDFDLLVHRSVFFNLLRTAAYTVLGLNTTPENAEGVVEALQNIRLLHVPPYIHKVLPGEITTVRCVARQEKMECKRFN